MFEYATEFFDLNDEGFVDINGPFVSHVADVESRKTLCGKDIGVYYEGWVWGKKKLNCKKCMDINNLSVSPLPPKQLEG